MASVKIKNIFEGEDVRLGIKHIVGKAGMMKETRHILVQRYIEGKSFWNRLIPDVPLIVTPMGLSELGIISSYARETIFQTIISSRIPFIALSQTDSPPECIISFSETYKIPVISSTYDEYFLESRLIGLMREKIDNSLSFLGACVNVYGFGVIIAGESGSGKTECTRELVKRGHAWIADDVIEIERRGNALYGRGHGMIKDLINIKGKGVLDAREFLGAASVHDETVINLMIELKKEGDIPEGECLSLTEKYHEMMGIKLPHVELPGFPHTTGPHRSVEGIVQKLFQERGIT